VDQEAPVTTPRHNIFYRLQRYGHRKLPSLIPDPNSKEFLRQCRVRDEEENAKTEPPPDELIDVRCIWSVEFYTPSHITKLFQAFKELGWDRDDPAISRITPRHWIKKFRETPHGGGWYPLGPIHRPGDTRFFRHGRTALIPPHVDYALGAMYSLTSSITCIVICFILDENCSGRFDEALRRKRKTVLEHIPGGGYSFPGPPHQKTTDIQAIRNEMRASVANWFRTQLPGVFASGIMDDEFPSCEFVTLRKAQPFPKQDEDDHGAKEWLSVLDMDNDWNVWVADDLPGLKFAWPILRDKESRFHAIIAAREDAFSDKDLRAYGGGDRTSYVWYVNRFISALLSRWALLRLISGFERHLNNIRDSATFKPAQREKPLHLLRELIGHVSQSVDIAAAMVELRHFTNQKVSFERDLETFKPSNSKFYRDKEITLSHALREQVEERSAWLENLDRSIRDFLTQYGAIIGTRENIKLQKRMSKLTWLIAALTALTAYIAIKTGNIPWAW
jgi:hypothetical protein